ncbi:MAG: flagellar protein FlbB, partial [Rhizobiales bacterium]|nr:flagellar protein FlbB [Hyphomicrobiales bacterium]
MPSLRLIPIVLFATASLLALKTLALLQHGGRMVAGPQGAYAQSTVERPKPQRSWAQEMLNYPDVTGSVASKPAEKPPVTQAAPEPPQPPGQITTAERVGHPGRLTLEGNGGPTPGERVVSESLADRRRQLEDRAREMDIRESLMKAAEKRIDGRLQEIKASEGQIGAAAQKKEEAEVNRFKGLVTMYENMKAKDAARIFDRLEMKVLLDVSSAINPRRMADILAQMSPEAA